VKCARCNRPIKAAAAWSGGEPFGPTCAQILELVPVGAPEHKRAPTAAFIERRPAHVDDRQLELFEGFAMSRKKCIRKHWNTSPGFNPVLHAIAGACVTNKATLDAMVTLRLSALEAMTHGQAGLSDWRELVDLVNTCETAGLSGIGPEVLPWCAKAHQALTDAASRYDASGSQKNMGLSGLGIQAIRELVEYHRLQVASIPRSQYESLLVKTANRVRSGAGDVVELS